jgi:uncharacterized protein YcfL
MKNRRLACLVPGLLLLALLGSGCGSVNTVENAQKEGRPNMIADQRVITNPSLNRKLNVVGVNAATTPGGLLKVQVSLENLTHSSHRFLYQFEWFDLNGMQVNNALSASVPGQIEARESKMIDSISPSPACRDFRLKLIDAD